MRIFISLALLGLSLAAAADDHPSYQNGILTLPRVDTPAQVGQYQDATMRLTEQGNWQLTGLREMDRLEHGLLRAKATSVEVVKSDSFPVSVLLRTSGEVVNCGFVGTERIHQRRTDTHFAVLISAQLSDAFLNGEIACASALTYFKSTVVLDTYGLGAGTYTYDVNGIQGTFTLDRDNKYADDCGATAGCYPR